MTTVARHTTVTRKAVLRAGTVASARDHRIVILQARLIKAPARQVEARVLVKQTRLARVRARLLVALAGALLIVPTLTVTHWRRPNRASASYRTRSFSRANFNSKKATYLWASSIHQRRV